MPFNNFVPQNNAQGQLIAGISAGSTSMILQTGQGGRFPSTFPYLCEIKQVDTVSPFAVLKREIVKVTGRTGDTLTIVRSSGTCLPSDASNTTGTTAFSFSTGDTVTLTVTAETIKDIQDEVLNLGSTKLNKAGDTLTGLIQGAKSTNIASASTTNLATLTGNFAHITGTTTITSFGTVTAGTQVTLVFDGILTLTHNATTLILPGGANITTAVGDSAIFESEGSGNWKCVSYTRANGQAIAGGLDINGLTPVTTLADADEVAFWISGTGNRKITKANLKNTIFPFTGAKAIGASTFTLTNNSSDVIPFASEEFDTDTMHDNATNNSRITIKKAGYYTITGGFSDTPTNWNSSSPSILYIYKNGVEVARSTMPLNGTFGIGGNLSVCLNLAVNDYIQLGLLPALSISSFSFTADSKTFLSAIKSK